MATELNYQDIRRAAERDSYRDGIMEMVVGVLYWRFMQENPIVAERLPDGN